MCALRASGTSWENGMLPLSHVLEQCRGEGGSFPAWLLFAGQLLREARCPKVGLRSFSRSKG